jgi:hypothetical protein
VKLLDSHAACHATHVPAGGNWLRRVEGPRRRGAGVEGLMTQSELQLVPQLRTRALTLASQLTLQNLRGMMLMQAVPATTKTKTGVLRVVIVCLHQEAGRPVGSNSRWVQQTLLPAAAAAAVAPWPCWHHAGPPSALSTASQSPYYWGPRTARVRRRQPLRQAEPCPANRVSEIGGRCKV